MQPLDMLGRLLAAGAGLVTLVWCAAAEPARIVHGQQIGTDDVGPAAAGYATLLPHPGGVIRDDQPTTFARPIASPASYDGFAVAGPHLLIEGMHFTGNLDIQTRLPVVIRGSVVRPRQKSHWGVLTRPEAGPVLILWSEAGAASAAGAPKDDSGAVGTGIDLRGRGGIVYRSRVSRAIDGIHVSGSDTHVIESLIDDLVFYDGAHNDGVQMLGQVAGVELVRNRIMNRNPQTSAVSLTGRGLVVAGNYLAGGGYALYGGSKGDASGSPPASDVSVLGNVFGRDYFTRSGHFGTVAYWDRRGGHANVWSGNRLSTGESVAP